jgi:pyruvate,water dikinase
MCELPSNVILADEFSQVFDGFSIGSNDLTQLTLGLDRDSALVAHLFDERNEGVKRMVAQAIATAKANGRKDRHLLLGQGPQRLPRVCRHFLVEAWALTPSASTRSLTTVIWLGTAVGQRSPIPDRCDRWF